MDEIINKVANSSLEVFDLEDYYPVGKRTSVDIAQWLEEGILLKEKNFRAALTNHDWQQYQGQLVAIDCSTDAIIPGNLISYGSFNSFCSKNNNGFY